MRIIETTVYKFSELPDETKKKVIQKYCDINVDYEWWDSTYDDIKELGAVFGFEIENIYFGLHTQGSGCRCEGRYSYKKGALKAVKKMWPQYTELHRIAEALQALQARYFYNLVAVVSAGRGSNFYAHSNTAAFGVFRYTDYGREYATDEIEKELAEILRDFMDECYRLLDREFDYLTSKEAITETIEINDYEFTENGEMM